MGKGEGKGAFGSMTGCTDRLIVHVKGPKERHGSVYGVRAGSINLRMREWGLQRKQVCPFGLFCRGGVGQLYPLLPPAKFRTIPRIDHLNKGTNNVINLGKVTDDSMVPEAAARFEEALDNRADSLHWLAVMFLCATLAINDALADEIPLHFFTPWMLANILARYPMETVLGDVLEPALEKSGRDAGAADSGSITVMRAPHDNITKDRIGIEMKCMTRNRIDHDKNLGPVSGFSYADYRFEKYEVTGLFFALEAGLDGFPRIDICVVAPGTARSLMESRALYTLNSERPPFVEPGVPQVLYAVVATSKHLKRFPPAFRGLHREYRKRTGKVPPKRYLLKLTGASGEEIKCVRDAEDHEDAKYYRQDDVGRWREMPTPRGTHSFRLDDLRRTGICPTVAGIDWFPDATADTAGAVLALIQKNSAERRLTNFELNSECENATQTTHNSLIMMASQVLATILYLCHCFSEGKHHLAILVMMEVERIAMVTCAAITTHKYDYEVSTSWGTSIISYFRAEFKIDRNTRKALEVGLDVDDDDLIDPEPEEGEMTYQKKKIYYEPVAYGSTEVFLAGMKITPEIMEQLGIVGAAAKPTKLFCAFPATPAAYDDGQMPMYFNIRRDAVRELILTGEITLDPKDANEKLVFEGLHLAADSVKVVSEVARKSLLWRDGLKISQAGGVKRIFPCIPGYRVKPSTRPKIMPIATATRKSAEADDRQQKKLNARAARVLKNYGKPTMERSGAKKKDKSKEAPPKKKQRGGGPAQSTSIALDDSEDDSEDYPEDVPWGESDDEDDSESESEDDEDDNSSDSDDESDDEVVQTTTASDDTEDEPEDGHCTVC